MLDRLLESKNKAHDESGFTLIELLVVVIILGILAAVVVFAVSGITDKGQDSACRTDTRTIRTAEEANFAKSGKYDTEAALVTNGFLSSQSSLHNIVASDPVNNPLPTSAANGYNVTIENATSCHGNVGDVVGTNGAL